MMRLFFLAILGGLPHLACSHVAGPETYLGDRDIKPPTVEKMTVCTGDTCELRRDVSLTDEDRRQLRAFFNGKIDSPAGERERLKMAINWLEHRTGVHTKRPPVERLNGRKLTEAFWNYHSCIDDTSNTTTFLIALQKLGAMRLHEVAGPAYRGLVIDGKVPHFTAVIREKGTGEKYSVDTWLYTTGEPVIIKPLSDWLWEY